MCGEARAVAGTHAYALESNRMNRLCLILMLCVATSCDAVSNVSHPTSASAQESPRQSVHAGVTFVEETLGRVRTNETAPLIVLLHGLVDTPENFLDTFRALPVRARVAAARAFDPFSEGYAWFPPRRPANVEERAGVIRDAAARLVPAIRELAASHPTCGAPIVIGFSQGAMVAYGLSVNANANLAAVYPIAGYLPRSLAAAHAAANAPRIISLHGNADRRVALADDQAGAAALTSAGYTVDPHVYPNTDHTISPAMLSDLSTSLTATIQSLHCR